MKTRMVTGTEGEFLKKEELIEVNEKIPADKKGNFKGK